MHVEIHESPSTPGRAEAFRNALVAQCGRLGVKLNLKLQAPGTNGSKARVVVAFAEHGSTWTHQQNLTLERLAKSGVHMLPVIPSPPAARFIPPALAPVNAFVRRSFGTQWPQSLVDEVLSMAWLRRRTRKVFISYRRIDSEAIASQLYDRLNFLGYETFLDEASVRRGVDFQRELKWWLNDADLLLVLASPRYPASKWCMEELTFCQQRFIGVATVQWPKEIYSGERRLEFPQISGNSAEPVIAEAAMEDQRLRLHPKDFKGLPAHPRKGHADLPKRQITPGALDRIIALCARQRTLAIRQRLDDLMPVARSVLSAGGGVVRNTTLGDFEVQTRSGGKRSFVRVVPFRPQPESLRQSWSDASGYSEAGCLYAENDPSDERAEALRWLASAQHTGGTRRPKSRLWTVCGGVLL